MIQLRMLKLLLFAMPVKTSALFNWMAVKFTPHAKTMPCVSAQFIGRGRK